MENASVTYQIIIDTANIVINVLGYKRKAAELEKEKGWKEIKLEEMIWNEDGKQREN